MTWQKLIADLQQRGFSQAQIAVLCGCGQTTVSDLCKGKTDEPRHKLGQQLISLQKKSDKELRRLLDSKQKAEV